MQDDSKVRCPKCDRQVARRQLTYEHVRPRFLDDVPSGTTKICAECNMEAAKEQLADRDRLRASTNKPSYKPFLASMYEVEALLLLRIPDDRLSESFRRILFASVVTAMETYLADTFLTRTLSNRELLRRCVEQVPELKERKVELGNIFERYEKIETEVRDYLVGLIFHDLAKINRMYRSVLNVSFPTEMAELYRAVKLRHDIVHRSGKSKDGASQEVSLVQLRALVGLMKGFVEHVEGQLAASPGSPEPDL